MAELQTDINVKIKLGDEKTSSGESNLPAIDKGSIVITKDTNRIYIDTTDDVPERIEIGENKQDKFADVTNPGICKVTMSNPGQTYFCNNASASGIYFDTSIRLLQGHGITNDDDLVHKKYVDTETAKKQGKFADISYENNITTNDKLVLTPNVDNTISEVYFNVDGASDWHTGTKAIGAPYFKTDNGYIIASASSMPSILMSNATTQTATPIINFESANDKVIILRGIANGKEDNDAVNFSQLSRKQDLINYNTNLTVGSITTDPVGGGRNTSKLDNTSLSFSDKLASATLPSMLITPAAHSGTTPASLTFSSPAQNTDVGNANVRLTGIAAPTADNDAVNRGYLTTKYGSTYYSSTDNEFYLPSRSKMVMPNSNVGRLFMGSEGVNSTDFKIYVNDPIDDGKLIITNIKTPTNNEDAANKAYVDTAITNKQDKFASVSHPDPNGNVTWLNIDTPELDIYDSNRKSSIIMNTNGVQLCNITGLVKLNVNEKNIKFSKSANSDNNNTVSLLGVATPVTAADTSKDITEADLPYQVANKKYIDDIRAELLNAITHPYTYDETTKELTLIL